MKSTKIYRLLLALLIVSLAFNGCNKDDDDIIGNQQQSNDGNSNNGGNDSSNQQSNSTSGEITLYRVNGDNIEKIRDYNVTGKDLEYQKDVAKHQEMWGLVKKIVPPSHRKFLGEFMVFNGKKNGDGGYAVHINDDLVSWTVGLAIDVAQDDVSSLEYIAIHEFGHVLTLNNTQIDPNISESACSNYYPREGCTNKESYINKLYQGYWADIWSDYMEIGGGGAFYTKYKDRFVSEYASTIPGEDIAEVFASFVYEDKPSGSTTKAQEKILLMHDSNELTEIRKYIRGKLSLRTKSNSSSKIEKQRAIFKNKSCKLKH